jgi:hypothetical protein
VARFLLFLAVLATCAVAWGDIELAKDSFRVGEPIVIKVVPTGVPTTALLRGSLQVTAGSVLQPVATESTYFCWAASGDHVISAKGIWVVTDTGKLGGILQDFGMYDFTKTFTVGPEVPPVPFPPPVPPVPPLPKPGGPYQILLLYDQDQLDNLSADQRALLTSLVYRQKLTSVGHRVLGVFAAQSISKPEASKFKAFFTAVKDDPLPRIAIAKLDGGKVADFPLPTNMVDLEKLLATEVIP